MNRRRPLRHTSPKRAKEMALYRKLKDAFFKSHKMCVVCNQSVDDSAKSLHHYYGRIGALLNFVPGFRLTHYWCHEYIEGNRNLAVECGLRAPDNLFNRPSKVIPR